MIEPTHRRYIAVAISGAPFLGRKKRKDKDKKRKSLLPFNAMLAMTKPADWPVLSGRGGGL